MKALLTATQHLGLYNTFHQTARNRRIHNVGTPLVMFTGMVLTALIAPESGSFWHLGTFASLLLTLAFFELDVLASLVFGCALLMMAWLASLIVGVVPGWPLAISALIAHGLSWYLLIVVGHGDDDEAPLQTPEGPRDTHEYFRRGLFLARNTGLKTTWLDALRQFAIAPYAVVFELFEATGTRKKITQEVQREVERIVFALERGVAPFTQNGEDHPRQWPNRVANSTSFVPGDDQVAAFDCARAERSTLARSDGQAAQIARPTLLASDDQLAVTDRARNECGAPPGDFVHAAQTNRPMFPGSNGQPASLDPARHERAALPGDFSQAAHPDRPTLAGPAATDRSALGRSSDQAAFGADQSRTPGLCAKHDAHIWLSSLRCGNGHLALRDALARALEQDTTVTSLTNETLELERVHQRLVRLGDFALRTAWRAADSTLLPRALPLAYPELYRDAEHWLRAAQPGDVFISTHFAQALAVTHVRNRHDVPVRVVAAIPDYTLPPNSFCPTNPLDRADAYIVMSPEVRQWLIENRKLSPDRVYLAGYQPAACFDEVRRAEPSDTWDFVRQIPDAQRLDERKPTVLFLGGSAWTKRTEPVLRALLKNPLARHALNFIVVAGRDAAFEKTARTLLEPVESALVTGFVSQNTLAALMGVADVPVLGSGAPAMLQELISAGCGPWALFRNLGGSEDGHPEWVRQRGFGVVERDAARMAQQVLELSGCIPASARTVELVRHFPARAARERTAQRHRAEGLAAFLAVTRAQPGETNADVLETRYGISTPFPKHRLSR